LLYWPNRKTRANQKKSNNVIYIYIYDKTTIYNSRDWSHYSHCQGVVASDFGC
jgi:hypothetical protein